MDRVTSHESEDRYRDLVESTHDLIQSITPDGNFAFVNRAWLNTLGYAEADLPTLKLVDIIHPESLEHCEEVFARVIAGGATPQVEARFVCKDGREIFVEGTVTPRRAGGKVVATHGFFRDVTLRKQTEAALRTTQETYQTLVEQAPDAIFIADAKLRFIDLNTRACELSGFTRDEILQMSIPDFMLAEDFVAAPLKMEELRAGEIVVTERRLKRKGGAVVPVEVSSKILSDGRLQALVRDISQRKQAEAERERLVSILEATPDLVGIADAEGKALYLNRAGKRMLGFDENAEIPEFNIGDVHSEWAKKVLLEEGLPTAIHDGYWRSENSLLARSGREIPISQVLISHKNAVGNVDYVSSIIRDISERKQAEESMSNLRRELELTMNSMEEGVHRVDLHGKIVFENPAAARMLGWEVSELLGKPAHETMHCARPDGTPYPKEACHIYATFRDGLSRHVSDEVFWRQDGTSFPVEYTTAPMRNDRNEIVAAVVNFRDVTERKQAEADSTHLSQVLEASLNEIYMFEVETLRFRYVNYGAQHNLGYSPEQLRTMTPLDLKPEFTESSFRELISPLLRRQQPQLVFETVHRRADASLYPVEVHLQLVEHESQQVFVAVILDISERKQAETALVASEERYRTLFETAPDGVAVFDKHLNIVMVSQRALEIYGFDSAEEMIGLSGYDLIAPEYRQRAQANAGQIMEMGRLPPIASVGLKKDGTRFAVESSAALIRDPQGQPVAVLGVSRDITERKRAEEEINDLLEREQAARQEAEVMRDANIALTYDLSLDWVLATLLRYLRKLVPYDSANVMLLEGDSKIVVHEVWGYENFQDVRLTQAVTFDASTNPILRRICETGESVLVADTDEEPAWQRVPGAEHVRNWLGVPLKAYGKVIGLYSVDKAEPGVFTPGHARLAEALAAQAASAIQNAQLFEQKQSYAAELEQGIAERKRAEDAEREQRTIAEALRDTAAALNSTLDADRVLDGILENVERLVPLDTVDIMLLTGDEAQIVRARGYVERKIRARVQGMRFPLSRFPLLRKMTESQLPVVVSDTRDNPEWEEVPEFAWICSYLAAPIVIRGQVAGFIAMGNEQPGLYTEHHAENLRAFTNQASVALENARLLDDEQAARLRAESLATALEERIAERKRAEKSLRASREQLRALSARLQSAREEEGTRIAREIHDELGGALTGLKWDLEGITKTLTASGKGLKAESVREKIPSMTTLIDATIDTVRRISSELRPGVLDDLGLAAAIEWQAQQFQTRTGIKVECDSVGQDSSLNRERSTAVFRIFQEILTNVLRHAQATLVSVKMSEDAGDFVLQVQDNGRGITAEEKTNTRSLGLLGMHERAHLVGGEVNISGEEEKGTIVVVRLPIRRRTKTASRLQ